LLPLRSETLDRISRYYEFQIIFVNPDCGELRGTVAFS
jgi:methionine synthase II (cobalamin-independent)